MGFTSRFIKPAGSGISLDIGILSAISGAALIATAALLAAPQSVDRGVAVIFSPWTPADEALSQSSAAGGRFVRFGAFPFIAVVVPDDDGYVDRVLRRGAWFALDPAALAACLGNRISSAGMK
jgi:hypothetical protein